MILLKRNIDLKISNEELEYGMGFLLDKGKTQESFKHYVGYQTHGDQFYFEDKHRGNWFNMKVTMFMGYFVKNIPGEKLLLSLFLTTKNLIYLLIFHLVFIAIFFIMSFIVPTEEKIIFRILAPSIIVFFWLGGLALMLFNFSVTKDELKKNLETRLKVREYHRNQTK